MVQIFQRKNRKFELSNANRKKTCSLTRLSYRSETSLVVKLSLPLKPRLEEDGEVPELVRDLVEKDGSGGGEAQLEAGHE